MAKTNLPQKGFLSKLNTGQKTSLIVLIVLALALPLVILVSQLQTRISPHASYTAPVEIPSCVYRVENVTKTIKCSPTATASGYVKSLTFTCTGSTNKFTVSSTCKPYTELVSAANTKCQSLCPKATVTKTPIKSGTATPTPTKSTSVVCPSIYSPVCATNGKTYSNSCLAKVAGVTVKCSNACPCTSNTTNPNTDPQVTVVKTYKPI